MKNSRLLKVHLHTEDDVVAARQRARHIAELLGFNRLDQARIATAVSEIARNAFRYAQYGRVEFAVETEPRDALTIIVSDSGRGIGNLQEILGGQYRSTTGMGMGLIGTMRLMDSCDINTNAGSGTIVTLKKIIPPSAANAERVHFSEMAAALVAAPDVDPFAEIQRQNQELLQTLAELRARQDELLNLTRELEDTNRGVVALYAEVDEKAGDLRRADEMKTRFLSNMSHEFRTPLGSIHALSQLLLDRVDGELSEEQEKQVSFIKKAAQDLAELVNDLLDLAKIEAGKVEVNPSVFSVAELFSALRGMLRPLLSSDDVELIFEVAADVETVQADEAKLSQILRNFISNAVKFTRCGSICVRAGRAGSNGHVAFSVTDTGIGIAAEDLQLIFDEFSQVQNPLQKGFKGTGLGLPLCRQLANLLGGYIEVHSTLGEGSTFVLVLPDSGIAAQSPSSSGSTAAINPLADLPILIIAEDALVRLSYEEFLQRTRYRIFGAESLADARTRWRHLRPKAVVVELTASGSHTAEALSWLKNRRNRKSDGDAYASPTIVVAADRHLAADMAALARGVDRLFVKPPQREELLQTLDQLVSACVGNEEIFMEHGNYMDRGIGR